MPIHASPGGCKVVRGKYLWRKKRCYDSNSSYSPFRIVNIVEIRKPRNWFPLYRPRMFIFPFLWCGEITFFLVRTEKRAELLGRKKSFPTMQIAPLYIRMIFMSSDLERNHVTILNKSTLFCTSLIVKKWRPLPTEKR